MFPRSGSYKKIINELSGYLIAGIVGTAVHYLILFRLVQMYSLDTVFSSTSGAMVGAGVIYSLNYFLVFKSVRPHREAFMRFFLVACLGVAMNGLILKILISICDWHYLGLQILTTGIVFGSNFALTSCWTFAAAKPTQDGVPSCN